MAFAMKLAAKKAELSLCPYASEEAKRILGAAAEPPVRNVRLGAGGALDIGGETVLYRHEKTFVHQTLIAVNVNDIDPAAERDATLAAIKGYCLERVGQIIGIDLVCVTHRAGGSAAAFAQLCRSVHEATGLALVVRSSDPEALTQAAAAGNGLGWVLASATPQSARELATVAATHGHALAVSGRSLDEVAATTSALKEVGFTSLLLDLGGGNLAHAFQTASVARRAALRDDVKAMGYPHLAWVDGADALAATSAAVTAVCKYGGVCVLPRFDAAQLSALMTLRLNIYTDPQKPIQVEPKVYPIGEPTPASPVFVTTNFSLTYFIVAGEIENAGTSAWLVVPECEGMSVLTAWAAGKFSGASIAKFAREQNLDAMVTSRQMVIPGYVAQISGELEEAMPGWKVLVGPQEAADIESFVKARLSA
jgi:acetyl-CoA decarbonylase/synthase complex subunit gamma